MTETNRQQTEFSIKMPLNNVSFVSNAARCFQCLLKNTLCSPSWAFFETLSFCCFYSSLHCLWSAWWLRTCRSTNHSCCIPPDEPRVSECLRRRIWFFRCILSKKCRSLYFVFLHNSCIQLVRTSQSLTCGYCCASPQCSLRCYSDSEEKRISREDILWLDMPVVGFQTGGSDSVQCYEALRGKRGGG